MCEHSEHFRGKFKNYLSCTQVVHHVCPKSKSRRFLSLYSVEQCDGRCGDSMCGGFVIKHYAKRISRDVEELSN